jgi:hypothetical protein
VHIKHRKSHIADSHVDEIYEERASQMLLVRQSDEGINENEDMPIQHKDRLYLVNKMRNLFKQNREEGILDSLLKIISVPLDILRDYTTPIGEAAQWDRQRASIVPMTIVFAFFYLAGMMETEDSQFGSKYFSIGLICMIPGAIIGTIIKFKTKISEPPALLLTIYSVLCFLMAVMWIQYTSNVIMDLLQLLGFITKLPQALLALTIIAWGNELGDMTSDVAMTKRGFGEMAVTACVAGPVFNVLMGIGLSQTKAILVSGDPFKAKVNFSFYDHGQFDKVAILPFTLICGQLVTLLLLLINAVTNKFHISFNSLKLSVFVYLSILIGLILYSIIEDVQPPSG